MAQNGTVTLRDALPFGVVWPTILLVRLAFFDEVNEH
jgi:hypothetical protein